MNSILHEHNGTMRNERHQVSSGTSDLSCQGKKEIQKSVERNLDPSLIHV